MWGRTRGGWSWRSTGGSEQHVGEGAEPEGKALDLPVDLHSHPHLWSWALGSDWKNENEGQAAEMSFLSRGSGLSLRDRVRSSDRPAAPSCLVRILLGTFHWRSFRNVLPGNASGFPRSRWRTLLGGGTSGLLCLTCGHRDPTSEAQQKTDGWIKQKYSEY